MEKHEKTDGSTGSGTVIVVGNRPGESSSNPGADVLRKSTNHVDRKTEGILFTSGTVTGIPCKKVSHPINGCPGYDSKLYLVVMLQFWSSEKCGVPLRSYYSQLNFDRERSVPFKFTSIV